MATYSQATILEEKENSSHVIGQSVSPLVTSQISSSSTTVCRRKSRIPLYKSPKIPEGSIMKPNNLSKSASLSTVVPKSVVIPSSYSNKSIIKFHQIIKESESLTITPQPRSLSTPVQRCISSYPLKRSLSTPVQRTTCYNSNNNNNNNNKNRSLVLSVPKSSSSVYQTPKSSLSRSSSYNSPYQINGRRLNNSLRRSQSNRTPLSKQTNNINTPTTTTTPSTQSKQIILNSSVTAERETLSMSSTIQRLNSSSSSSANSVTRPTTSSLNHSRRKEAPEKSIRFVSDARKIKRMVTGNTPINAAVDCASAPEWDNNSTAHQSIEATCVPRPKDLSITRRVGVDGVVIAWAPLEHDCVSGFQVTVGGRVVQVVRSPHRTKALVTGLPLAGSFTIGLITVATDGRCSTPILVTHDRSRVYKTKGAAAAAKKEQKPNQSPRIQTASPRYAVPTCL